MHVCLTVLRRTGFKRPERERTTLPAPQPVRRVAPTRITQDVAFLLKPVSAAGSKAEERRHKDALAQLGCMVCRRLFGITDGEVELHHRRSGGWGRGDYLTLIPLCVRHHRGDDGVHGLGTKGFVKTYGFDQQDMLDDALRLLHGAPRIVKR